MQTSSLVSVRLELLKYGYFEVEFFELYCLAHGAWRCSLEYNPGAEIRCPQCGAAKAAVRLAKGFVKSPGQWERARAPLSRSALSFLQAEPVDEAAAVRREQHRGNPRAVHYEKSKLREARSEEFTWASKFA